MNKKQLMEKSIAWNKGTVITSVILLCCIMVTSCICGMMSYRIPQSIEKMKTASLASRILSVNSENLTWELKHQREVESIPHVEAVFSQDYIYVYAPATVEDMEIEPFISGNAGTMLPEDMLTGEVLSLRHDEVMIPSVVTLKNGKKIKGTELLGKQLILHIQERYYTDIEGHYDASKTIFHEMKLKIVGVYDARQSIQQTNQIFTTMETCAQIARYVDSNIYDYRDNDTGRPQIALVDNYRNITLVEKELSKQGYIVGRGLYFDYTLLYGVLYVSSVVCIVMVTVGFLIIYLLQLRNLYKKEHDIGMLLALGYTQKQLLQIMAKQIVKLFVLAAIPATILYLLIYPKVNEALFTIMYFSNVSWLNLPFVVVYLILIPLLMVWCLSRRMQGMTAIELLKEDEE